MDKEFRSLGKKLMDNCLILTEKLYNIKGNDLHFLLNEYQSNSEKNFFYCLGYTLIHNDSTKNEKLAEWARFLQEKTNSLPIRLLKKLLFPSHLYKTVIMDFLEEEINSSNIHPKILIHLIKKIDSFIEDATDIFSEQIRPIILKEFRKYASTLKEEKITLRELRDLINALKEATILAITDNNDIIKYANKKFCQITKYQQEELLGQNHHNLLFSGYHSNEFFDEIKEYIRQGRVWKGEIRNKAKDGSYYWVDNTIIPFLDRNGNTYQHIAIQHDITDKKNAEEMLRKTEKLSLVGELAAGIAHEIRNPLTTIRGFVQILDHFSEEKKFLYSKTILDEIDRINFIVSEFMVFAKPQKIEFKECNLTEIIKNVIHFMGAETTMKNVEITDSFHQDEIFIFGEKNQLTQVFINMIKNAIDALPNGGMIKICSTTCEENVLISIQDNGIGMTEQQVKKIGEPFYTLKENGNGLGLMVSYKIIENHRGKIIVNSEPNKGTTFNLSFPLLHNKMSETD